MIPIAAPDFTGNERRYVTEAVETGWVSKGAFIGRFEQRLTELFGLQAVACSSGTAALHLALLAAEIGPGDEVIVPDLTFAATASVVKHVGATPVLVDVDESLLIDPACIDSAITERTKAIIPVHLYGHMVDVQALREEYPRLTIIEDAAEIIEPYHPAGHFACLSFYGNKWITTGEGGAVLSTQPKHVRLLASHGMHQPYQHSVAGLNYRMTNLQAAVGCAQLEREPNFRLTRQLILSRYEAEGFGCGKWLRLAPKAEMTVCETRPVFTPLHRLKPFKTSGAFIFADRAFEQFMCLPAGPHLTDRDLDAIIEEHRCATSSWDSTHASPSPAPSRSPASSSAQANPSP